MTQPPSKNMLPRLRLSVSSAKGWAIFALLLLAAFSLPSGADTILRDPLRTLTYRPNHISAPMVRLGTTQLNDRRPLDLLEVVRVALSTNPQTREAYANINQRAASLGRARALYLPQIQYSNTYNHVHQSISFPDQPTLQSELSTGSGQSLANLSWVIFDSGQRSAQNREAKAVLDAAYQAKDVAFQKVIFESAQSYYKAQAAKALDDAAQEAQAIASQSVRVTDAMYRAGVIGLPEKLQADTALAQAKQQRIEAEDQLAGSFGDLALAMGIEPRNFKLAPTRVEKADNPLFNEQIQVLMDKAIRRNPNVRMAEAQVTAAEAHVAAERADGRPTLSFIASLERDNTPITSVEKEIYHQSAVGLSLRVPIFDGFTHHYAVREAQASLEEKRAELDDDRGQTALEAWKSFQELKAAASEMTICETLVRTASASFEALQSQFRSGYGDITALLKAQADLADAKQKQIAAVSRWEISRLRLVASLGLLDQGQL